MIYTLDFEFHEAPRILLPFSIGVVAEDGREYYAEWLEYLQYATFGGIDVNDFVKEHVLPQLTQLPEIRKMSRWYGTQRMDTPVRDDGEIKADLLAFLNPVKYGKPEIWGYFADYDWVLFCQTFGRMVDLPEGYPYWCRDLKQEMEARGLKRWDLPKQEKEHHALEDARWNMQVLKGLQPIPMRLPPLS